ncbi:DEKNAAC105200 [Brettanomyces naardenensis]|uniref:DEKNAAC105200 n=1 Tax=Brettanomyces naardenensis TaxID=13370 RepID=A0A448YSU3_BRENA|nr:DEKNAAC105200 [Brettanomyces naardenensis]
MPKHTIDSEAAEVTKKRRKNLVEPNYTIYVKNLNDKVSKSAMQRNLYVLFSTYCDVVRISYRNKGKLRGQAWLNVSSIEDAELALVRLRGISMFGKKVEMEFSGKVGDVTGEEMPRYT